MNATSKRVVTFLGVILWASMALHSPSTAQTTRGADVAVVVDSETPVTDLSLSEYWNSKLPVVLLIRAPAARERDVVLRVIYQMSEAQFKQYWVAKIFRAEAASPPRIVYSNDMQYELLTALPGSIAFVDSRNIRPGVKVLRVDGHMPGEKDYPLR